LRLLGREEEEEHPFNLALLALPADPAENLEQARQIRDALPTEQGAIVVLAPPPRLEHPAWQEAGVGLALPLPVTPGRLLQALQGALADQGAPLAAAWASPREVRCLLVENDPVSRLKLTMAARRAFPAACLERAPDWSAALTMLGDFAPDLVVGEAPPEDGSAMRALEKLAAMEGLAVVAIGPAAPAGPEGDRLAGLNLAGQLGKPYSAEHLSRLLAEIFAKSEAMAQGREL